MRLSWSWKRTTIFWLCVLYFLQGLGSEVEVENAFYEANFQHLLQSGQLDLRPEDDMKQGIQSSPKSFKDASDSITAIPSSPWSYAPTCIAEDLPGVGSKLCVYTNTLFSNGRGMSLFTTPQIAAEIASSLDSTEHDIVMENVKGDSSESWYTATISGKGTGMLAKCDLHRGDVITSYTPVLLAHKESALPEVEREQMLQLAVKQLPPPSRDAYLSLTTIGHDPTILAQDIPSANAFEMIIAGVPHLAVIPEPSRFNHDCAPNAIFLVNSSSLTHTVRATRLIEKHEEITIAYTSPFDPFAKRQAYLSTSFGFNCTCSRCTLGRADDATLFEIASLQHSLAQWAVPTSSAAVKQAERLIRLHLEAGLDGYLDPAYCGAALMYSAVGSERGARKHVELCIEAIELRLGRGADDLPLWKAMLENPTAHWSWRRRKKEV